MLKQLIRQFHFSKAERHGAVALLSLAALGFFAPEVYRLFYRPEPTDFSAFAAEIERHRSGKASEKVASLFPFDPNTATVETFIRLGLPDKVARTIVKYRERGGRFRMAADLQKIYVLSEADFKRLEPFIQIENLRDDKRRKQRPQPVFASQPFHFDPNTATEQELLQLGLPSALASRLLRYREKGGRFSEKTDFRKLYGLSEADYRRLEPFIKITQAEQNIRPASYAGGKASASELKSLDINRATIEDWMRLPGIGPARAKSIVRFREKLGGFTGVSQLSETWGLPDSIFQKIRSQLVFETAVFRKINLNTATVAEFNAHPYFTFKQGQLIVNYREQHGLFREVRDLEKIVAFTDKVWLERVMVYLEVK